MGTNFTSLFAYYLASPANWLIALFPQRSMIEIMNAMIIVKLAAASVSFAYYIAKHFHTKSCSIALSEHFMHSPASLPHTAGILCGWTALF